MAARHYTLTLNGAAQRLSTVLATTTPGGPNDEALRQIILCAAPANTAVVAIGATSSVTTTDCGFTLDPTQATAPDRVSIGPFETGPVKLSDLYAIGTNGEKLHIFAIPF